MMTPFNIREEIAKMRRLYRGENLEKARRRLYLSVLEEISRGSLDPRSLAIAALEAENGKRTD